MVLVSVPDGTCDSLQPPCNPEQEEVGIEDVCMCLFDTTYIVSPSQNLCSCEELRKLVREPFLKKNSIFYSFEKKKTEKKQQCPMPTLANITACKHVLQQILAKFFPLVTVL